jgi:chromosome segregation ATPase
VLEQKLATAQHDVKQCKESIQRLRNENDTLLAACASLERISHQKTEEITKVTETLLALRGELAATTQSKQQLQSEVAALQTRLSVLSDEKAALQSAIAKLVCSSTQATRSMHANTMGCCSGAGLGSQEA